MPNEILTAHLIHPSNIDNFRKSIADGTLTFSIPFLGELRLGDYIVTDHVAPLDTALPGRMSDMFVHVVYATKSEFIDHFVVEQVAGPFGTFLHLSRR